MKTIYALASPRTGEIRYVGQTNNLKKRMRDHKCDGRNAGKTRWLKRMKRGPKLIILDEAEDADLAERWWIATSLYFGNRLFNIR